MEKKRPSYFLQLVALFFLFEITATVQGAVAVRLCGQKLVNIIKHLCNHRYQSPQTVYNPGYYANQRQPRSGIVESCCWKQCTYAYLKTYCDDPDTTTASSSLLTTVLSLPMRRIDISKENRISEETSSDESSSLRRSRQHFPPRRGNSMSGESNVWHEETATISASTSGRPVKTFRSLFHLLSYLSQFLSPPSSLSDVQQSSDQLSSTTIGNNKETGTE